MTAIHTPPSHYLPHIDGLRALAVMSVIVYHLNAAWLPRGYLGVDVFFVISGFVVSWSVAHWQGVRLPAFLLAFYARRLTRIMPALVVCLLGTFLLSALFIPPGWLSDGNERTGRLAFWGLGNWALARGGNDYFSPRTEFNPFTHTWSLGVEEQFYLVFPLVFVAWLQARRRLSQALMLLGVGASLLAYVWMSQRHPGDAFYLSWFRFWQLGAGVLLYQFWFATRRSAPADALRPGVRAGVAWLGVAVLLAAFVWPVSPAWAGWPNLLAVLGTVVLIAAGGWAGTGLHHVLLARPVRWVGQASYSLYLWHWPVFVLARWTVGLDGWGVRGTALLLTLVLAWASLRWVEQPLRRWGGAPRKGRVVAVSLAGVALAAALAQGVEQVRPVISQSVVSRHAADWLAHHPQAIDLPGVCRVAVAHRQTQGVAALVFEPSDCGALAQPTGRLFVFGDSHAMHFHAMYDGLARLHGLQTHVFGTGGCAYLGLRPAAPACAEGTERALAQLQRELRAGDVLMLSSLRVRRMVDHWAHFHAPEGVVAEMTAAAFVADRDREIREAVPVLKALAERGVKLLLPAPTPIFRTVPYRCSDAFNRNNPICRHGDGLDKSAMAAMREPVLQAYGMLMQQVDGTAVWDPLDVLCPGPVCSTHMNGRPMVFDGDHLSGYGNALLLPHFTAHLRQIGLLR
jgi:peptidoglycan/LPS O-acetylase OafA/YrhL